MNFKFNKTLYTRVVNLFIPLAILGIFLGLLSVFSYYKGYNTICPIKIVSGFPCPGCGMTRAHLALLHLNFSEAFYYHPLFILPSLFAGMFLFQEQRWVYKLHHSKWFYPLMAILIIGVYIYRMLTRFPAIEPLDYLEDHLIKGLWETIIK